MPTDSRSGDNTDAQESKERVLFDEDGIPRFVAEGGARLRSDGFADDTINIERELRRRGKLLPVAVAVVALAAFSGVVWYAYSWGVGNVAEGDLPVITAEAGPEKVRPESPGGLEVPHQDKLILNEVAPDPDKPQVERLLPPPEVPKPPKKVEAKGAPATPKTAIKEVETAATAMTAPEPPPPPPPPLPAGEQPAPAKAPTPEAATAATKQPIVAEAAPKKPAASEPSAQKSKKQSSGTQAVGQQQAAAIKSGDIVVQLASFKSQAAASKAWVRLQKALPGLLGGMKVSLQSVDLGDRGTFYRLHTGPFPNRATAQDLCAQLKLKKQDCLVVRR